MYAKFYINLILFCYFPYNCSNICFKDFFCYFWHIFFAILLIINFIEKWRATSKLIKTKFF